MAISQIPAPVIETDEENQSSLDLWGLLHALLRYLWLILLCTVAAGIAAWLYVRHTPDLYRSTAVIEIQSRNNPAIDLKGNEDEIKDPEAIETTVQNFRHRSLMERVAKQLDLTQNPAFLGYRPAQPVALDAVTDRLLGSSTATRRSNTRLIDVTFVHPDPVVARRVTNSLVYQFIEQRKEERTSGLREQNELLKDKYKELKDKLAQSEKDIQDYKRKLTAGPSDSLESVSVEDRRNYVEDKLRGLNSDLQAASGEKRGMESDRELIRRAADDPKQLLGIASLAQDPQVVAVQAQLNKTESDLAALMERYGDKHPRMIEQRAQVANARALLAQTVRSAPTRFDSRYQAAVNKEISLSTAVSAQEKALLSLEDRLIPYRELVREYESNRALAESILQKLKESTLALGGGKDSIQEDNKSGNFQVVEPAVSAVSLANRRLLIIAGCALAGALLGAGIVAGMHLLNTTFRTVDAAEQMLGLPVLATVPIMAKSAEPGDMLALIKRPDTAEAESFRTLRCALSLLGSRDEHRVFLFTSAVPGEGKSLASINTAISFAQQGYKTLLVEADLRRPSVTTKLLGMGKQPGLGDYVAGQATPITSTSIPKLFLLSAGTRIPNPAELLSGAEFQDLFEWMKTNFDRIVIDTAPVNVVSDTLNIVACASVICLVVRSNSTSRKAVQRAIELLRRSGVRPDGIVLNCMPRWSGINNHYNYSSRAMYGDEGVYAGKDEEAAASRQE